MKNQNAKLGGAADDGSDRAHCLLARNELSGLLVLQEGEPLKARWQ